MDFDPRARGQRARFDTPLHLLHHLQGDVGGRGPHAELGPRVRGHDVGRFPTMGDDAMDADVRGQVLAQRLVLRQDGHRGMLRAVDAAGDERGVQPRYTPLDLKSMLLRDICQ